MNAKLSLPIGSIVVLKESLQKVMIVGFLPIKEKVYDYLAVYYPEGIINNKHILCIDEENIESILTNGYHDKEEQNFKQRINNVINN